MFRYPRPRSTREGPGPQDQRIYNNYKVSKCRVKNMYIQNYIMRESRIFIANNIIWSSPRPISTGPLNTLLCLHSRPIYHVFYMGPYSKWMGYLILRGVSRLDAFSVYPCQTWLPSCATGVTTGTPSVCPSRSSRTKDRSSQISCARDR